MEFTHKKLPREEAARLISFPISEVTAFTLIMAPVYVYMKRNEKFVSVKAPLDFFTPEELDRLRSFELFYYPPFAETVVPFANAGRRVRMLLSQRDPPPPYELSDQVIRAMGPLWSVQSETLVVEPFFVAAMINDLCQSLPAELLHHSRDRDVGLFERAVILSSLSVFLALHLGFCDLPYLTAMREQVFRAVLNDDSGASHPIRAGSETESILALSRELFEKAGMKSLQENTIHGIAASLARKLSSRLERIKTELVDRSAPVISIFGEKGFASG